MANNTYNLGRVVGFSAYEEFLKEYPELDPTTFSKTDYLLLCSLGLSYKVTLPKANWRRMSSSDFYHQIVAVPGAKYKVVPIYGLNYEAWTSASADVDAKEAMEEQAKNIYSCRVVNANGTPVTNASQTGGHLEFLATPAIVDSDIESVELIVRGLAMDTTAWLNHKFYTGPMGFGTVGIKGSDTPIPPTPEPEPDPDAWHFFSYERSIPSDASSIESTDQPMIDLRSAKLTTYFSNYFTDSILNATVQDFHISDDTRRGAFLAVYAPQTSATVTRPMSALPPALYGTRIEQVTDGEAAEVEFYPIDCAAPHTLKLLEDGSLEEMVRLEDERSGVHALSRNTIDYVVKERMHLDTSSEDDVADVLIPVADTEVQNIYGLRAFAQRQFRFQLGGHPDGAYAIPSSLKDLSNVTYIMTVAGFASESFMRRFVVQVRDGSSSRPLTVGDLRKPDSSVSAEVRILRNIFPNNSVSYINSIPEEEWDSYWVIIVGNSTADGWKPHSSTQQLQWVPIRPDGWIEYSTSNEVTSKCSQATDEKLHLSFWASNMDADPTADPIWPTGKGNRWDLMGTWWNGNDIDNPDGTWSGLVDRGRKLNATESDPYYPFLTEHPGYTGVFDSVCYQPHHACPKPPADSVYGNDWTRWFNDITMLDYFTESELTEAKIHDDYWEIPLNQFFVSAVTADLSLPRTPDNQRTDSPVKPWYLFSASSILELQDRFQSSQPAAWNCIVPADTYFSYTVPRQNMFSPQFLKFETIPRGDYEAIIDSNTAIQSNPGAWEVTKTGSIGVDVVFKPSLFEPAVGYSSSSNALWASQVQAGTHTSLQISLTDGEGAILPLEGTYEAVTTGELTWSTLLAALANNQRIVPLDAGLLTLRQSKFQVFSIVLDPIPDAEGATNPAPNYQALQLDAMVYASPTTSRKVCFAKLTVVMNTDRMTITNHQNWYQRFKVAEASLLEFKNFSDALAVGDSNTLRVHLDGYPSVSGRPSSSLPANAGAPTSSDLIVGVLSINLKNSEHPGILYFRNNGQVDRTDNVCIDGTIRITVELTDYHDSETPDLGSGYWA